MAAGWPNRGRTMCNLYSMTRAQDAVRQMFAGLQVSDAAGNWQPGQIYPDYPALILRHAEGGLELARARWGMPSPGATTATRDPGLTNVRNLTSRHWQPWLRPAHRCLVPFTAFSEPLAGRGPQWFAPADGRPAFFAGIEVRGHTSMRKVKEGVTTNDLFAFLTTEPNAEVARVHPKAMPVILTEPEDWARWMAAPVADAVAMQRPLPDGELVLIEGPV